MSSAITARVSASHTRTVWSSAPPDARNLPSREYATPHTWPELETRIATLFSIPSDSVAVTYEDSDNDVVTLSSQPELVDYLASIPFNARNEQVKFNVINTKETRKANPLNPHSAIVEDTLPGGIPNIGGATMIYELGDQDWQRIPGMPNVFSMREPTMDVDDEAHAFVEVIDSEAPSPRKGTATPASEIPTPSCE